MTAAFSRIGTMAAAAASRRPRAATTASSARRPSIPATIARPGPTVGTSTPRGSIIVETASNAAIATRDDAIAQPSSRDSHQTSAAMTTRLIATTGESGRNSARGAVVPGAVFAAAASPAGACGLQ